MTRIYLLCLLLAFPAHAGTITGRVTSVTDGDTFKMSTGAGRFTVRLEDIDAPERGQEYGEEAKALLTSLIRGQTVVVETDKVDRHGRTVGDVTVAGQDVGRQMVSAGAAWAYTAYNDDPELVAIEAAARLLKKGLWADQRACAPWDFRKHLCAR